MRIEVVLAELPGEPDDLANDHIPDYGSTDPPPDDVADDDILGGQVSKSRLLVAFTPTATVGEVNDALDDAGVRILGGMPDFGVLVVARRARPDLRRRDRDQQEEEHGVEVYFYDLAGHRTLCDPIVISVVREDDQLQDETFHNVAQADSRVTIYNGNPGMRKVVLIVNGKKFKEVNLKADEVRKFDVASAMMPGYTNTITVRVRGRRGASALIVIADIP